MMRYLLRAALFFSVLLLAPNPASATEYVFHETSALPSDFSFAGSISINCDFSDLPTIDLPGLSGAPNPDLSNLLALDFSVGILQITKDSLISCFPGNLPPRCADAYVPDYSISPFEFFYLDGSATEDVHVGFGANAKIIYASDDVAQV
jgi:hypothetical protein